MNIIPFGEKDLSQILDLTSPPLPRRNPFRQLDYIQNYVRDLGCKSIVLENHYIDRHFIEDFSLFYSKNLINFDNYCRRITFFSLEKEDLEKELKALIEEGRSKGKEAFEAACKKFSEDNYLGYSVIKPLNGSPVGRTILKCKHNEVEGKTQFEFGGARWYKAHLLGIELSVYGLAFQQQDIGVSACATTAIWSSIQKARNLEGIKVATPAQITMLASKFILPFGRPFPSEGLSVDQMCQAIQSLGLSPHLLKENDFEAAKSHLYSAISSGLTPILILGQPNQENSKSTKTDNGHAVTAMGIAKLDIFNNLTGRRVFDKAGEMNAVFVHDDRFGPYIHAYVRSDGQDKPFLRFEVNNGDTIEDDWFLTHLLIPMHPKIRTGFTGLHEIALKITKELSGSLILGEEGFSAIDELILSYEERIIKSTVYKEELIYGENPPNSDVFDKLNEDIPLSRYVGIVKLASPQIGSIDIVVDTTSTPNNLHFIVAFARGNAHAQTKDVLQWLSDKYGCKPIFI